MSDLTQIILLIIGIARFLIFAHIIVSLLVSFQILNPQQPFVRSIWEGLDRLFDPIYTPIRNMLPNTRPLSHALGISLTTRKRGSAPSSTVPL